MYQSQLNILLAVRNQAHTLRRAVLSILAQTFEDYKLIIIDDQSKDAPLEVIRDLIDKRIYFIRFNSHKNLARVLNYGLSLLDEKCQFVGRMDADDWSNPGRLNAQLDYLNLNAGSHLVSTWFEIQNHKIIKNPVTNSEIIKVLHKQNPMCHGALVARREVYTRLGGYDENMTTTQDWELYLRAWKAGFKFYNIPKVFYYHGSSREKSEEDVVQYHQDLDYLRRKHFR